MSNDVSGVLHGAAAAPTGPPDVPRAWRRGRRMRVQRRALSALAIVAVVGVGSFAVANIVGNNDNPGIAASPTTTTATCAAPTKGTTPAWAASANPPGSWPHIVAPDGNVVAVVFGAPLAAPPRADKTNKILWIVRQPRDGHALEITATLPGSGVGAVHVSRPADSSPGEIYPTIVDVPRAGCWHFDLVWNHHRSSMNLAYTRPQPAVTPTTSSAPPTPTTTTTTVPTTGGPPTTCATANLALTLGPQIGSAGHFNYEIAFRNTGPAACVMTGFPGVSFTDASGTQIGVPAARNPIPYTPVTIAPGATAYAHLAVRDTSVVNCPPAAAHQIRVYPPNETATALVPVSGLEVCSDQTIGSDIDPVLDHSLG
jgi:hypothetical protein